MSKKKRGQLTAKRTTTVLGVPRDPRAPRDKHPLAAWQGVGA